LVGGCGLVVVVCVFEEFVEFVVELGDDWLVGYRIGEVVEFVWVEVGVVEFFFWLGFFCVLFCVEVV